MLARHLAPGDARIVRLECYLRSNNVIRTAQSINPREERHGSRQVICNHQARSMKAPDFFDCLPANRPIQLLIAEGAAASGGDFVDFLHRNGVGVAVAHDRVDLLNRLKRNEPDLMIFGRRIGVADGLETLQEIRRSSVVPVIMSDAREDEEIDRIVGLELGADDYISTPFHQRELLARVRAVLRRIHATGRKPERARRFKIGPWVFDQQERRIEQPDGAPRSLTKGEFALLCAFVQAPHRTLSREHLLQATRMHEDIYDRSIDVQVLRLRKKLDDGHCEPLILTERGLGYRLDAKVTML
jgi:two-component system OmpR family response regulator